MIKNLFFEVGDNMVWMTLHLQIPQRLSRYLFLLGSRWQIARQGFENRKVQEYTVSG